MHVFVYGTLRRSASHPSHGLLMPATCVGRGRFQGRLYDLGSYPAAVASADPADVVHGEIYLLHTPDHTLPALDRYEGCSPADPEPHEYVRVVTDIRAELPDMPIIPAQIYLYAHPVEGFTRIDQGDYLTHLAGRSSPPAGG